MVSLAWRRCLRRSVNITIVVVITIVRMSSPTSTSTREKPRALDMGVHDFTREPDVRLHARHEAPFRPLSDGYPACGGRSHGDLQPAARPAPRRQPAAPYRRHRRGALPAASRRADRHFTAMVGG